MGNNDKFYVLLKTVFLKLHIETELYVVAH